MAELDGTTVLVTGATSGLGRAMAGALVAAGARVALSGRDRRRAEGAAGELGAAATGIELDVRDEGSVAAGVAEAWRRLGRIDMLVNNAGIGMRTVNPRFLSHAQPFWEVAPPASATCSRRRSPAASWSRARRSRACSRRAAGASSRSR
jgi:NAD(P)-dependent dehydrogenase (short-subunit alcohol dehydrogenase family)